MLKNNDEMFNKGVIWAKNVIFYNDIIFGSVAKKRRGIRAKHVKA